jgi:hypothetical protein
VNFPKFMRDSQPEPKQPSHLDLSRQLLAAGVPCGGFATRTVQNREQDPETRHDSMGAPAKKSSLVFSIISDNLSGLTVRFHAAL